MDRDNTIIIKDLKQRGWLKVYFFLGVEENVILKHSMNSVSTIVVGIEKRTPLSNQCLIASANCTFVSTRYLLFIILQTDLNTPYIYSPNNKK